MAQQTTSLSARLARWVTILIVVAAAAIRLVGLDSIPPALYWEEVALGYDAYSLLKTGKDHHGEAWPIVALKSFGDYKPALYAYTIMPFIPIVGLSAWAVRLPSVLAGVSLVVAVGWLTSLVMRRWPKAFESQWRSWLPVVVMAGVAFSPWAIQFSRGGWEVNLAVALQVWGICLAAWASGAKQRWNWLVWLAGIVLLVVSMYTYHAARITAPLLGLTLLFWWLPQTGWRWPRLRLSQYWQWWLLPLLVSIILLLPLLLNITSNSTQRRFQETSFLRDGSVIQRSVDARLMVGDTQLARLLYHRYWFMAESIMNSYLLHLHPDYLFVSGDSNWRHGTGWVGIFWHLDSLFLLVGIGWLVTRRSPLSTWLLAWWLIGIFPATITEGAPHALRTLITLPAWYLVWGIGIVATGQWLTTKLTKWLSNISSLRGLSIYAGMGVVSLFLLGYTAELISYARYYTFIYPREAAEDWQDGYQEMLTQLAVVQTEYQPETIYITRHLGRPLMAYWFFNQVDPQRVQAAESVTATQAKMEQGEFLVFENIYSIHTSDEISAPSLAAMSLADYQRLSQRLTVEKISEIRNRDDSVVWIIANVLPADL